MIKKTIKDIEALVDVTKAFYNFHKKDIRFDAGLNDSFLGFFEESQETIKRLKDPYITIATVGTTSSGKSTILNGMIGRDIAPSDMDEMSAGILKFTPSEGENKLSIFASPEGYWNSRVLRDKEDDIFCGEIKKVFDIYKEKKSKRVCSAPQIEVKGEFLWNKHKQMFDVPDEVKFRFLDLPGLRKEKGDQKNLAVIQDVLNEVKPLSILAMDYSCLATPEELDVLLKELSETVRNLNGSTDSIIFLLNKVDLHNAGGATSLEQNIEKFRKRVINKLSTELPKYNFENIKIIPFVGILFNNAQLSIGLQSHKYTKTLTADSNRLSLLVSNCGKTFDNTDNDDYLDFYDANRRPMQRKQGLNSDDARRLLEISYDLSHANELIDEINKRIRDSFYEIVIYPAIFKLKVKFELLQGYLRNFFSVSRLNNQIAVYARIFGMLDSQIRILGTTESTKEDIKKRVNEFRGNTLLTETKVVSYLTDTLGFVDKLNISDDDKNNLKEFLKLDLGNAKYFMEMIVAQALIPDTIAFSKEMVELALNIVFQDEDLLYSETKKHLQKLITNDDEFAQITEELSRKYSLVKKYNDLYDKVSGEFILGEVREKYNYTIESNNFAAEALESYSSACQDNYNNVAKVTKAKELAYTDIKSIRHTGVSKLYIDSLGIIDRIKGKIQYDLMSPFMKVYPINPFDEVALEKELTKNGIKKSSIIRLVEMFSIFRTQFKDWSYRTVKNKNYILYKGTTKPSASEYLSYSRKYQALNNEMRLAMSDLMGYNVQLECQDFVENLTEIINKDTENIISGLNCAGFDLDIASIVKLLAIDMHEAPSIPKEVFEFADPFKMDTDKEARSIKVRGGCCPDYETIYEDVYIVQYPTIEGLYDNWTRGLAGSEKEFWKIIVKWVNETIIDQQSKIEKAIAKVSEDILNILAIQRQKLQDGSANRQNLLEKMEKEFTSCSEAYKLINA